MMLQPKIITTMRGYGLADLRADVLAGLTVAMVAIPLSIAIAIASGARPMDGLVTAIVAGFLISLLGGSRVQIGGPTGAFIVVVFGIIAAHGYDGLVIATLMAGLILIVAGWLRAGSLIAFVPEAVVNGFTIGIAAIIATSQLKDALGLQLAEVPAEFIAKIEALWSARASLDPAALGIAALTGVLIVGFRRLAPRLPGLILAVAIGSAVAAAIGGVDTVASRYGELRATLPLPHLPAVDAGRLVELFPSALVIAFLAGVESLLSALVADRMIGGRHRPNAEIMAQGFANLGSALFGGLPATGAIARTATNVRAGGRTPVAGVVHALVVLVALMTLADLAGRMAMPALAALLILVAWSMSEPHKWRGYMAGRVSDRVLMLMTMVLTVLVDLTIAIGVGVAVGLALRLQRRRAGTDWTPPER